MLKFEKETLILDILEGENIAYKKNKSKNTLDTEHFSITSTRDLIIDGKKDHCSSFEALIVKLFVYLNLDYKNKLFKNIEAYEKISKAFEVENFDIRILNPKRSSSIFYQAGDLNLDTIFKIRTKRGLEIKACVDTTKFIIKKPDKSLTFFSNGTNYNRLMANNFYNDDMLKQVSIVNEPKIIIYKENKEVASIDKASELLNLALLKSISTL